MTSGVLAAPLPADHAQRFRAMSKSDQWICWWSMPVFYNLFGLIFVVLTRVMPPPGADRSPEKMVAFFQQHSFTIKAGFGLLMIVIGFASWATGLIALHMKRMSVGSVWAYVYIAVFAIGALPGCLLAAFSFLAAVFRPDRDPRIVALLYDVGLLTFIGSLGCFAVMYLVLALAILLDRNQVFPRWLAWVSVWQIVTEVLAAPVFVFKDGPFAWDGAISFWQGTAIFVCWQASIIFLLRKAIQQQPLGEPIRDI